MYSRPFRTRRCFRGGVCLSEECRTARNVKIVLFFPFLPASSKTSVWLRASPHSSDANGRRNVEMGFFFFFWCVGEDERRKGRAFRITMGSRTRALTRKAHGVYLGTCSGSLLSSHRRTSISFWAWMGFKSLNCCCYN